MTRPPTLVGNRSPAPGGGIETATQEPATELTTRIWGGTDAEVTATRDLPPDARSVVRLLIAEREVEGIFGLGPFGPPAVNDAERPA